MSTRGALWAVSTHFNPCHYRQRLSNPRVFRERLGVPLLTVELSCDGVFELEPGDADRVLQLSTHDVLWQKERLLNLAIATLPESCDAVAWLDGDVLFERQDWGADARRLLETFALVQLYSHFTDLPRDGGGSHAAPRADVPEDDPHPGPRATCRARRPAAGSSFR